MSVWWLLLIVPAVAIGIILGLMLAKAAINAATGRGLGW